MQASITVAMALALFPVGTHIPSHASLLACNTICTQQVPEYICLVYHLSGNADLARQTLACIQNHKTRLTWLQTWVLGQSLRVGLSYPADVFFLGRCGVKGTTLHAAAVNKRQV